MKKLLVIALTLGSFAAFADDNMQGKNLDEKKAMVTQKLDQRIEMINKDKACIAAATTQEAFKSCMQSMKAERKAIKAEWQQKKAQWKANKKNKKGTKQP